MLCARRSHGPVEDEVGERRFLSREMVDNLFDNRYQSCVMIEKLN